MPPKSEDWRGDIEQLRHELFSSLTLIHGQTQLLQRQLRRMDGFSDGDRQRLETGLSVILASAQALEAKIDDLTAESAEP